MPVPDTNRTSIEEEWPYQIIGLDSEEAITDVIKAIETVNDDYAQSLAAVYKQRFVETATGKELEKLGAEVGVTKETGESEERFRFRVQVSRAISKSEANFPEFAQMLYMIFEDDATAINIAPATDDPVIEITVPSDALADLPVTRTTLETLLLDALPASDGLTIISDDAWLLGESGSQGLGEGGLS